MTLTNLLYLPIGKLWGLIVTFRRFLYQSGFIDTYKAPIQVIAVGNLRLGGTGKTPLVEYLAQKKSNQGTKSAILSRGYGRKTRGFFEVTSQSTVNQVGDETIQLFNKLGDRVSVNVCERRVDGIKQVLQNDPAPNTIILDDAFQHCSVRPSLNILLTAFNQPFYRDWVVPAGRLREPRSAAKHADLIVVSKCPEGFTADQKNESELEIKKFTGNRPILFARFKYTTPMALHGDSVLRQKITLVSGIANPKPLTRYLTGKFELIKHFDFSDHHDYTESEVAKISTYCLEQECSLFTTSKDIVKLKAFQSLGEIAVFVQPIEFDFLFDGEKVLQQMMAANQ